MIKNDLTQFFQNFPCLKFDINLLNLAELPELAMSCFDHYCKNIDDKLEDYSNKIHNDLKKIDSAHDRSFGGLETLGIFLPPKAPSKNANILLCPKRIKSAANSYSQNDDQAMYEFFYTAIETHEHAHASMCPQLYDLKDQSNHDHPFYTFIEESLATAAMLLEMKEHQLYSQLEHFVASQPVQYRYGLILIQKFTDEQIVRLMCIWKNVKSNPLVNLAVKTFMECLIADDTTEAIAMLEKINTMILPVQNIPLKPDFVEQLELNSPNIERKILALAKLYSW